MDVLILVRIKIYVSRFLCESMLKIFGKKYVVCAILLLHETSVLFFSFTNKNTIYCNQTCNPMPRFQRESGLMCIDFFVNQELRYKERNI